MIKKMIIFGIIVLAILAGVFFIVNKKNSDKPGQSVALPDQNTTKESGFYYPISDYDERLKIRKFGTRVVPGDEVSLACGQPFDGYHTGDDLEILPGEENAAIPVRAITDGVVERVGEVSGYGGLVIISHDLQDKKATAYYGHLSLSSIPHKKGDSISGGEVIGNLGKGCSEETDFERKHLHFDIYSDSGIDLRGYTDNKNELSLWLDPKTLLMELSAIELR